MLFRRCDLCGKEWQGDFINSFIIETSCKAEVFIEAIKGHDRPDLCPQCLDIVKYKMNELFLRMKKEKGVKNV